MFKKAIPLVFATGIVLAGCGNGNDDAVPSNDETPMENRDLTPRVDNNNGAGPDLDGVNNGTNNGTDTDNGIMNNDTNGGTMNNGTMNDNGTGTNTMGGNDSGTGTMEGTNNDTDMKSGGTTTVEPNNTNRKNNNR